jgi:hypothetical protein
MTRRRWVGVAGSVAVAACVISAGATALAAAQGPHGTHTNYRGPAVTAHPGAIGHQTNYRGPARTGTQPAAVHGSNLPAGARSQHHATTQRGSK